jgi:zinc transporter ZupT
MQILEEVLLLRDPEQLCCSRKYCDLQVADIYKMPIQILVMIPIISIIAALIAGLSDLIGGWISQHARVAKISSRYFIGFAAGTIIAAAFFEVLPQVNIRTEMYFLAAGFFFFYLLERAVMIHSCGEGECKTHSISAVSVAGMASDNILDGAGIAIGFLTSPVLGIILTIAVIIHEVPQGISSGLIMKAQKYSKKKIYAVLIIAALLYPIGAFVSGLIPPALYSAALAFVAGDFIYIGASDLLPEAHKKFNFKVVASVFLGLFFIIALSILAPGA